MIEEAGGSKPEAGWFWDAYLHWSARLGEDTGRRWHVPVFLRARGRGAEKAVQATLAELRAALDGADVKRSHDRAAAWFGEHLDLSVLFELSELVIAIATNRLEFYVYLPRDALEDAARRKRIEEYFHILDVGFPVRVRTDAALPVLPAEAPDATKPVVAVIDDGVGFLNRAFTRTDPDTGTPSTRFIAFWLQAAIQRPLRAADDMQPHARSGRVLAAGEIDDLLAEAAWRGEAAVYQRLHGELREDGIHNSLQFPFSHGTHVLDLAAGALPGVQDVPPLGRAGDGDDAVVRDWPLLAVQLPPEAIADTSGTRMETHVVMGLRWVLAMVALRYGDLRKLDVAALPPVVVNVSLGVLAGPKDGSMFLEHQIARDLEVFQSAHVVYAYGNAFENRQVARFGALGAGAEEVIDWVIQPDDFTPCFMEIHAMGADGKPLTELPETLEIGLTDPLGVRHDPVAPDPGAWHDFGTSVRLYHVEPRQLDALRVVQAPDPKAGERRAVTRPALYALATTPTARPEMATEELTLTRAGSWRVHLRNTGTAPLDIRLQIQSGDNAPGYPVRGRQSYFDHRDAYGWNSDTLEHTGLGDGPITHEGTHSAFVTLSGIVHPYVRNRIAAVAGAMARPDGEPVGPAAYSAMGDGSLGTAPRYAAVSEDGTAQSGVLASGTFSGTVSEVSGTSTAAPQAARLLAHKLAGHGVVRDLVFAAPAANGNAPRLPGKVLARSLRRRPR